jgi:hypothetical protein
MYRGKGNTAAKPGRVRKPSPAVLAQYIAESIQSRTAEGRAWTFHEYGIQDNPEMMALVRSHLGLKS